MKDIEPKLKKKFPDLKRTQLVAKMGGEWRTKSEYQKAKYQRAYEKDKKVFDKVYEAYVKKWGKPRRKRKVKRSSK